MKYLNEVQEEIRTDSELFFPDMADDLPHHLLGLAGEVGEVANLVKKAQRGSEHFEDPEFYSEVVNEVVDTFIYIMSIANILSFDMGECYDIKRTYNYTRFHPEAHFVAEDEGRISDTKGPEVD